AEEVDPEAAVAVDAVAEDGVTDAGVAEVHAGLRVVGDHVARALLRPADDVAGGVALKRDAVAVAEPLGALGVGADDVARDDVARGSEADDDAGAAVVWPGRGDDVARAGLCAADHVAAARDPDAAEAVAE